MVKTKTKLWSCCCLLALNLIFIWGNSLLPGHISGAISDWAKEILKTILSAILPFRPSQGGNGGLLRKLAHFTEFTCLGLLLSWLFQMLREKKWERLTLPLICGIPVAAADETIQIFVPDRGPALKDVGIDTAGVLLGIVIITLVQHFKKLEETKL